MNISAILCCSVHIAGSMQEVRWTKKDRRYVHKLIVYGSWKMKLLIRIDANTIKRMKQIPVDDIWLEQLEKLAMSAKYTENYPYKEEVIALYEGLTDEEKQTDLAMNTYTYPFPPQVVEVGDEMADADLYDLKEMYTAWLILKVNISCWISGVVVAVRALWLYPK